MKPRTGSAFLIWKRFQSRAEGISARLDLPIVYLGWHMGNPRLRALEYPLKLLVSCVRVGLSRPGVLWIQVAPSFLLWVAGLYRLAVPRAVVVADCHNGIFYSPWIKMPATRWLLRRVPHVVVVHNREMAERAESLGVAPETLLVWEDAPATARTAIATAPHDAAVVLFAAGFGADEPLEALKAAATLLPDITFVITGDSTRAPVQWKSSLPANCLLTGWLSVEDYHDVLGSASVMLALTTREGVQLSAASEAIGFGVSLVVSDTAILRELFPAGAVHVQNSASSIAGGIRTAFDDAPRLRREQEVLRASKLQRWEHQAAAVAAAVDRFSTIPEAP